MVRTLGASWTVPSPIPAHGLLAPVSQMGGLSKRGPPKSPKSLKLEKAFKNRRWMVVLVCRRKSPKSPEFLSMRNVNPAHQFMRAAPAASPAERQSAMAKEEMQVELTST
jgi:hypothetical protein